MNATEIKVGDVVTFAPGRYPVRSVVTSVDRYEFFDGAVWRETPRVHVRSLQSKRTGVVYAKPLAAGDWYFPSMRVVTPTEIERRHAERILAP